MHIAVIIANNDGAKVNIRFVIKESDLGIEEIVTAAEACYRLLQDAGYRGPIAYNSFGIADDVYEHHRRTLETYKTW